MDQDENIEALDDEERDDDGESGEAKPKSGGSRLKTILAFAAVTLLAMGLGGGFGTQVAAHIESIVAERAKAVTSDNPPAPTKYSGDLVLQTLEPVIVNLASPSDTWIRLESAIVFKNGAVENPPVTGAEIRQDILAYLRTISLAQLEGPSALQHIREDLNERVATRTNGRVSELVIQSMIVQ